MALLHYFLLSFLTISSELGLALHSQDLLSLLSFKASVDPLNSLLDTWEGSNPCSGLWVGVKCYQGRVVSIFLDDASLVGSATPLFGLSQIRVLSLRRNALSGSLPHLTNLTNPRLRHLFLSHNQLDGTLNISLPSLLSLRIEHNDFSGRLEGLHLPSVADFNVSVNRLAGEISGGLSKFPSSAFHGNPTLCGSPLPSCSKISHLSNATNTSSPSPAPIIVSTCSSRSSSKLGITTLLSIGIGDIVVIAMALAIVIGMYTWFQRRFSMPPNATTGARGLELDHGFVEEKEMGRRLVCFEGGEDLRLDSLLKASAEVLGKGMSGSTYKAVLEDGIMVAVKRLSAVQFPSHSKAFNQRMHLIGRLRHSHVVSLRAYCNAHEEKLLVYDYMPNGSLYSLLQSNRGRNLDWRSRKQILMGVAHGLNFIHTFPARPPLVHANIKPSNILIDEQGNACITECSIMCFAANFHQSLLLPHASTLFPERRNSAATSTWHGYRAPELTVGKGKVTQESDVYSFGMVLLEVVTDKEIDDGECEGEMMGMVKIGMMCTAECPDERPKMSRVLSMMGEFL
ncbi:probable leucine-rich repeat receptor-like protein kinase At1g68400 [Elaeis guineensis]|uniref:Probable leucine-rich repeat receptor-like protein kinase At1g68400 n=1 Tax=Elaeis guineensis var. tenera TaxID=51953 RepID=A0A6I9S972_ELAGV|nr:probable leucine-rich repeat receptor-like protein kinase At1g68400 [Elaeis guineensis]